MSTDQRFEELDQKWSDRFNRLEALLLAKTLDQPQPELPFNTVKVVPAHPPPANVIRSEPFIKPTNQSSSQPTDRPSVAASSDPPALKPQADQPQAMDRPATSEGPSTSVSSAFQPTKRDTTSESDSDSVVSDRAPVDIFVEEGELSDELDATTSDTDQSLSEEQSYRETMRGIQIWDGPIFRTLIQLLVPQMTTPLLDPSCKHQARCQFNYPQLSGFAESMLN